MTKETHGQDFNDMLASAGAAAVAAILTGDAPSAPYPPEGGLPPEGDSGNFDDYDPSDYPDAAAAVEGGSGGEDGLDEGLVRKCADEPLNDTGNARRLLHNFGGDLVHVESVGWHGWSGKHWTPTAGERRVTDLAQQTAERINIEADFLAHTPIERAQIEAGDEAKIAIDEIEKKDEKTDSDKKEVARLGRIVDLGDMARIELRKRQLKRRAFALTSGNTGRVVGMISMALPHRSIEINACDRDPHQVNVDNGTISFERERVIDEECPDPSVDRYVERWSAVLRPHNRLDMLTKVAPVAYDPEAQCPRFMAFLDRFQPKPSIRRFLQAYHGYAMTGLTGEQCLVFNYGLGANGKSTLVEIICRIMGEYALTLPFESIAGENGRRGDQATPDLARLPGSRLVRASEPERNVHFKESLLKSLTGGEPMLVRHLNKGFFEFVPTFKMVLSGNTKPEIGGVDHGIWRRMRLVPWEVTIPDNERRPIEEVLSEFWEERSGILNWLVEGVLIYLREGLVVPSEIIEATAEYRDEMDPVGGFITNCVDKVETPVAETPPKVQAREMYDAFERWARHNSIRPWKERSFANAMSQKGFLRVRETAGRFYVGVSLHDVPAAANTRSAIPPHPADDDNVPV